MQYWQRKLQRSVTDTRRSPISRPWPSRRGSTSIEQRLPCRSSMPQPPRTIHLDELESIPGPGSLDVAACPSHAGDPGVRMQRLHGREARAMTSSSRTPRIPRWRTRSCTSSRADVRRSRSTARARRARRHVRVHPRSGVAPPRRGCRASDDRAQLRRAADVRAVRLGVGVSRGAVDADRSRRGPRDPRRGPEGQPKAARCTTTSPASRRSRETATRR